MSKIRVYELARSLGVDSKQVIDYLNSVGHDVKNHMSVLNADAVARARSTFAPGRAGAGGHRADAARAGGGAARRGLGRTGGWWPGRGRATRATPAPAARTVGGREGGSRRRRPPPRLRPAGRKSHSRGQRGARTSPLSP